MLKIGMNTETLFLAIGVLYARIDQDITAIQFEDGSGLKYNVQLLSSSTEWKYMEVTREELTNLFNRLNSKF